jgi:hypothetical protein
MFPLDRERSIKKHKYKGVFDVRLSQGKIEHPTFFLKSHPNGCKTKPFGSLTMRANIHKCFVPFINVYKTSLSIFKFTVKLKTCSMLPISTVSCKRSFRASMIQILPSLSKNIKKNFYSFFKYLVTIKTGFL